MTRSFAPLAPPPGGLAEVVREGRRRRRRRSVATASAAGAACAAVLALAASVAVPAGGPDSLRPLPPAGPATPEPTVGPTTQPTTSPAADASAPASPAVAAEPSPDGSGPAATPGPARPQQSEQPPAAAAAGYRTPDLLRAYDGPPRAARLCGQTYSNDSETGSAVGWCLAAVATATDRGADLRIEVCRDGTTAGRLTFATDHEADLEVLDEGAVVWRWSAGRPPSDDPHDLAADVGGCWSWTAPWTGVDGSGQPLEPGSYVLRVRSRAAELDAVDPEAVAFSL